MKILKKEFYQRDTVVVARDLIGKTLVRKINNKILSGIITETEAYRGLDDPASHAYRGITPRTKPMFGPVGHAYIYFVYGNYFCFNITARTEDQDAGAVLIRAIKPIDGIELMQKLRGRNNNIADGPGKLCQAMKINKDLNGMSLMQEGELFLIDQKIDLVKTVATPRIGIKKGIEKQWRFMKQ